MGAVIAAQRLPGPTTSVGGGADVLLDRAQQTYELMDYERLTATSDAFIICVRGEPPDGEALGSLMRLFGRFLAELP